MSTEIVVSSGELKASIQIHNSGDVQNTLFVDDKAEMESSVGVEVAIVNGAEKLNNRLAGQYKRQMTCCLQNKVEVYNVSTSPEINKVARRKI